MSRYPRSSLLFDGALFHVTWKCHNGAFLLKTNFAKQLYYDLLLKYKDRYGMIFYSFCLMDNHPHLTGKCRTQKEASDFFRVVNGCFARKMNDIYSRKGQFVMDRFKSPQIQSEEVLQKVMVYIDLNPFRTKKKIHPSEFKWSSFHHYAYGKKDPLITEPQFYLELGANDTERQKQYLQIIEEIITQEWEIHNRIQSAILKSKNHFYLFVGDPHWVKEKALSLKAKIDLHKKMNKSVPKVLLATG